jgi:hypothetical protein
LLQLRIQRVNMLRHQPPLLLLHQFLQTNECMERYSNIEESISDGQVYH